MSRIIRVSTLAKDNNVRSVDIIRTLTVIAPDLGIRSASSRVDINRDNRIFWDTVVARATFMDLRSI